MVVLTFENKFKLIDFVSFKEIFKYLTILFSNKYYYLKRVNYVKIKKENKKNE